jgi:hypothetical protein
MTRHPVCSRCQMTLAWVIVDGRHVLACPRASCEGHQPPNPTLEDAR